MVYQRGSKILATDINGFLGDHGTQAYPSLPSAGVGAVYGNGFGSIGYGQTDVTQGAITAGTKIFGSQWRNLANMMNKIRLHQVGFASPLVPPLATFNPGSPIRAHNAAPPSSNAYDIPTVASQCFSGAQSFSFASQNQTSGFGTIVRIGTWGAGDPGTITCFFRVTFTNSDQIRYFFNAGNTISFNLSQPGSNPQDLNWNDALVNRLGQIRFGANGVTTTGSLGLSGTIGYWTPGLTTAYNNILTGVIGTAPYQNNSIDVYARYGGANTNGSRGTYLEFEITLSDHYTTPAPDQVAAGTTLNVGYRRSTNLVNPNYAPSLFTIILGWG